MSAADQEGLTALGWACVKGQKAVVQLLAEAGADLNQPDRQGRTPLDLAALTGDADTVGFMRLFVIHHVDDGEKKTYKKCPFLFLPGREQNFRPWWRSVELKTRCRA